MESAVSSLCTFVHLQPPRPRTMAVAAKWSTTTFKINKNTGIFVRLTNGNFLQNGSLSLHRVAKRSKSN